MKHSSPITSFINAVVSGSTALAQPRRHDCRTHSSCRVPEAGRHAQARPEAASCRVHRDGLYMLMYRRNNINVKARQKARLLVLLAASVCGCAGVQSVKAASHTVQMTGSFTFVPASLTIAKGDSVT